MFKIISDPEEAADFGRAGVLWWVSKEDGGHNKWITTCPCGEVQDNTVEYITYSAHRSVFGVRVDE